MIALRVRIENTFKYIAASTASKMSSASAPADAPSVTRHSLAKEHELRLEVGTGGPATIKLMSGSAEVFGVELAENRTYTLSPGRKLAVYTWYGAELVVGGNIAAIYTSQETHMPLYANLHQRLEARREEARTSGIQGPRVLVCGPVDSGKSTLCRILCAYACRVGRCPTFVDVDLGQGELSIPGTLSASPLDRACLSVEDSGGYTATVPLVHYFGHATPGDHLPVYKNYLHRTADVVNKRMAALPGPDGEVSRASGLIINTMGWIEGGGYELLLDSIRAFGADVVVVMGHDRLFVQLTDDCKKIRLPAKGGPASAASEAAAGAGASAPSDPRLGSASPALPTKAITVVKLPRSGGVVDRSREYRAGARKARITEYFYGPDRGPGVPPVLSPEIVTVKWEDVQIVRVGGAAGDQGLVPIGKSSAIDPLRVQPVVPGLSLLNHVLGVSYAPSDSIKAVPHFNIAGFVHVRAVNTEARTLTLLAPSGGPLPARFLIQGSTTWVETA